MQIRKLTDCDVDIYRDIRLEMLKNHPDMFGMSYSDSLNKTNPEWIEMITGNGYVEGVFENDRLYGVTGLFFHEGEKQSHKAQIWGVYVRPDMRGKKLSLKLMERVFQDCPEDIEQILLHVDSNNHSALSVYQEFGFKQFGVEPKARKIDNIYHDEIMMVKFIKEQD